MASRNQGDPAGTKGSLHEPVAADRTHRHRTGPREELFPERHPDPALDGAALAHCVQQGSAHNCMFLAALAALAHGQPDLVRAMIRDNADGSLGVRFFRQDGEPGEPPDPLWIDVSRKILRAADGSPVFARTRDADRDGLAELWVAVVEKAYTLYIDRYLRPPDDVAPAYTLLDGIHPTQALKALTGWTYRCLTTGYSSGDPEAVLASLQLVHDGVAVQASCGRVVIPGLIPGHAYSVLGMYTRDDGTTMVRLRNPWGTHPAEDHPDPTPGADEGTFALTFEEFVAAFWDYYVPVVRPWPRGPGGAKPESHAVRALRRAAHAGDPEARYRLGVCLDHGHGVAQNAAEAVRCYRLAADQGHAHAQFYLGVCLESGTGAAPNKTEAMAYYRRAADQGHANARHNLGLEPAGRLRHTTLGSDRQGFGSEPVDAQRALPGPVVVLTAAAGASGAMHVLFTTPAGRLWLTTRAVEGAWSDVVPMASQMPLPGPVVALAAAEGRPGDLHLVFATGDGRLWHSMRGSEGAWSHPDDVSGSQGLPALVTRVTAAEGAAGEVQLMFTTRDGRLWHTIRYADGAWSGPGDVASVVRLPGPLVALGAAGGLRGEVHFALATEDVRLWHTIRYGDGGWSGLGNAGVQVGLDAAVTAVAAATGPRGDVRFVVATRQEHLCHTTRNADGAWTRLDRVADARKLPGRDFVLAAAGWASGQAQLVWAKR